MRPSFIYGASITKEYGYAQKVFISLFAAHFIKRELETVFVHKFSRPTMPLRNIFKNSIYYWSFAAFIGYILCHPDYTEPSATQVNIGAVAMVINELLNFAVHYQLSTMRKGDGDTARNVPEGPLFSLVSCPNYFLR
ncbi:enoyl reductase [Angomonas deanei]|nr:enoyl reductase [Angomonas deanei]|eukprot:EPY35432.1 enoyl reductase [Angomonas deanei]